jgi:hypothetical protein
MSTQNVPPWDIFGLFQRIGPLPTLRGALCVGQSELFDSPRAGGHNEARQICQKCPALAECRRWVQNHNRDVSGFTAGRVWPTKKRRR